MWRAGLIVCVTLAGCSRHEDRIGSTRLTAAELPTSSPTFVDPSPALTHAVESAIANDHVLALAGRNVEVTVNDGVATLRGTVPRSTFLRDLERRVSEVPGIIQVKNEVIADDRGDLGLAASDDRIAFSLQRSLSSLPEVAGEAERVSIDVFAGGVTLRGKTRTAEGAQAVRRIVRNTPGVLEVRDQLETSAPETEMGHQPPLHGR